MPLVAEAVGDPEDLDVEPSPIGFPEEAPHNRLIGGTQEVDEVLLT